MQSTTKNYLSKDVHKKIISFCPLNGFKSIIYFSSIKQKIIRMEPRKISFGITKNIRIKTISSSNSGEKQKNRTQSLLFRNCFYKQSLSLESNKLNFKTSNISETLKVNQKRSKPSIFVGNNNKKRLTLSQKQNYVQNNCKNQDQKNENKEFETQKIQSEYILPCKILNLFLREKKNNETLKNQLLTENIQHINYTVDFKVQNVNNQEQKVCKIKRQNVIQKSPILKTLKISHQYSFFVSSSSQCSKTTVQTQTDLFTMEDKYFFQYAKYRELKVKHYEEVLNQQQKLKSLIGQTVISSQNYENLMKSVNQGPKDDRQKRIQQLSIDLQKYEGKVKESMKIINKLGNDCLQVFQKVVPFVQRKKGSISESICHLLISVQNCIERSPQSKLMLKSKRMIKRILNQVMYWDHFDADFDNDLLKMLSKYQSQITDLQIVYKEWLSLLMQNKVLLYNFMKQIQKIPTVIISLFGLSEEEDTQNSINRIDKLDKKSNCMSIKCDQCFHVKNKIKFVQLNNQKIQPVFRSIQWLIRDCNKKQSCFQLI